MWLNICFLTKLANPICLYSMPPTFRFLFYGLHSISRCLTIYIFLTIYIYICMPVSMIENSDQWDEGFVCLHIAGSDYAFSIFFKVAKLGLSCKAKTFTSWWTCWVLLRSSGPIITDHWHGRPCKITSQWSGILHFKESFR